MVGKEEDNQYETLQVENEEEITDAGQFAERLLELYNDDKLEKLIYNFVKNKSNETIQGIINDPTLKKRIQYLEYDDLRQSIKEDESFIKQSEKRSKKWVERKLATQKKSEIQQRKNEMVKKKDQYSKFQRQNDEYKIYVQKLEDQQKKIREQAKEKKKEIKQIDYNKLLPELSATAQAFLKEVDNNIDAYKKLVNIQKSKSSIDNQIDKIDERLEIYRKFTYIIYLFIRVNDDTDKQLEELEKVQEPYWKDQNYMLETLKYTDVFNENSDNAYNVFKKLFVDKVKSNNPPKVITEEMRQYIGQTDGVEDDLFDVINFCPKELRKKLDKNTGRYTCGKDGRKRQAGSAPRKKCARRGGKGGIPTKRLTAVELESMGVAAKAARNLCLTKDEIKEANNLKKKNNSVILEKFFEDIRAEHGQGFHPTKEKKVGSDENKKRGRKKKIPSGDTQQSTHKTGGEEKVKCKPITVSQEEYDRLKAQYPKDFDTKIKVKRGKGNELKVKTADYNGKGICVTHDERRRLIASKNPDQIEKILQMAKKRSVSQRSQSQRQLQSQSQSQLQLQSQSQSQSQQQMRRKIKKMQMKVAQKTNQIQQVNKKLGSEKKSGSATRKKCARRGGKEGIPTRVLTKIESNSLGDVPRNLCLTDDEIKEAKKLKKNSVLLKKFFQDIRAEHGQGFHPTKQKKVGSGENKKRGRKKKIPSGDDTQQNTKKTQQMRRKINEVLKKIQQQNAKVKQNQSLLQKKRQAQKKQNKGQAQKKQNKGQAQKKQNQIIQLLSDSQYDDKSVVSDVSDVSL